MKQQTLRTERFRAAAYLLFFLSTAAVFCLCVCLGSVTVPPGEIVRAVWYRLQGFPAGTTLADSVVLAVRLPRVLCVGLTGAALSVAGAAMQGLLRNPLADGTTLGVTSGASLGAVLAIAFGVSLPGLAGAGSTIMAMTFAFLSLLLILTLAYRLDYTLSTNTIILVGVIFSMFANSLISLVVTFAGDRVRTIMFWTMGSLSGRGYGDALTLFIALVVCGGVLLGCARELNAFAVGEENARHIGVNVRRIKLIVLAATAALVGVCVSVGGTIGFVGLVIPHMTRMLTGPNHRRLLPASLFAGASFLMLADLLARTVLRPLELPIGVVTSLIGSVVFVWIFYTTRKGR